MVRMRHFSVSYRSLTAKLKSGKPFGLLSQQTSPLGDILQETLPHAFKAVFSAEHGYFGLAAPGEHCLRLSVNSINKGCWKAYAIGQKKISFEITPEI